METRSVLFAAGQGKRLRPLTDRIAKPGLPLLDVPLAAWGLSRLTAVAAPTVVNASHRHDELVAALEVLDLGGWEPFIETPDGFGTAGTLRALRDRLAATVLTCNGDVVADFSPAGLLDAHARAGCLATLAVRRVGTRADLHLAGDRVVGFIDRRRDERDGAQFLGIAVFEREALERLPDERPAGLGETLLRILAEERSLAACELDDYWRDVGTPHAYLHASLDVLYGRAPKPPVPVPGHIVDVDGGVAYVGPGAQVKPSSLRAGAIVLDGAVVAEGATLRNAVVFSDQRVPPDTTVEDAVWFEGGALEDRLFG